MFCAWPARARIPAACSVPTTLIALFAHDASVVVALRVLESQNLFIWLWSLCEIGRDIPSSVARPPPMVWGVGDGLG